MTKTEIIEQLIQQGKTVATAESCTGGMIAAAITDVPGASAVFGCGAVTYSNEMKRKILGVKEETLNAHGAVSPETAREMAEGLKALSGADIAVAVTGIAGPGGGSEAKPVGLVYLAAAAEDTVRVSKNLFRGDRDAVRRQTTDKAFELIAAEL